MKIEEFVNAAIEDHNASVNAKKAAELAEDEAARVLEWKEIEAAAVQVLGQETVSMLQLRREPGRSSLYFTVDGVELYLHRWAGEHIRVGSEAIVYGGGLDGERYRSEVIYRQDGALKNFLLAIGEIVQEAKPVIKAKREAGETLAADIAAGRCDEDGDRVVSKGTVLGPWKVVELTRYDQLQDQLNKLHQTGHDVISIVHDAGQEGYGGSPIVIALKRAEAVDDMPGPGEFPTI